MKRRIMESHGVLCESPPVRGRGLKRKNRHGVIWIHVAPRAGARIETSTMASMIPRSAVAPRAGARIET